MENMTCHHYYRKHRHFHFTPFVLNSLFLYQIQRKFEDQLYGGICNWFMSFVVIHRLSFNLLLFFKGFLDWILFVLNIFYLSIVFFKAFCCVKKWIKFNVIVKNESIKTLVLFFNIFLTQFNFSNFYNLLVIFTYLNFLWLQLQKGRCGPLFYQLPKKKAKASIFKRSKWIEIIHNLLSSHLIHLKGEAMNNFHLILVIYARFILWYFRLTSLR